MPRLFSLTFSLWLLLAAITAHGQPAALTPQALLNGTYRLQLFEETRQVTLHNGAFDQKQPEDFLMVRLIEYALGDLNGDGASDAAVILIANTGGSGSFFILTVMLNEGGKPRQVASTGLGDRVVVKSLAIQTRIITVRMKVHGPRDPACCPTVHTSWHYRLKGNYLVRL